MMDATVSLFLKHNLCFRETDPLNRESYLVFPELINLYRPEPPDPENITDDASYRVQGAIENVYASLVVLLGYTNTFTRTNQWRNQARYEVGDGLICGFKLENDAPGELTFVLYFGTTVGDPIRNLFRSLFESFLLRHDVDVRRFEAVKCSNGHQLNRAIVREHSADGIRAAFCSRCGDRVSLPDSSAPTPLSTPDAESVRLQSRAAILRSRLEHSLFRLRAYSTEEKMQGLKCFVSYAWGDSGHERWVERRLASDLSKAGVDVILDRWHNAEIGSSVPRFVEMLSAADKVVVVGTRGYRAKYDNIDPSRGYVVAAEGDIIGMKLLGSEAAKKSVLPALRDGAPEEAFPPLLQGRVYADFRAEEDYYAQMLELALSIYSISPRHPIATELRDQMQSAFS